MITQWLIKLVGAFVAGLGSIFPHIDLPDWLVGADSKVSDVMGQVASVGAWVPLGLGFSVAGFVLLCWGIGFTVKVIRIAASFLTVGGGSAG